MITHFTPTVDEVSRIYAVGDIHGCHSLLIQLLNKISDDAEKQNDGRKVVLIFLGDYIDRGEESAEVLNTLNRFAGFGFDRIVCLKGNHEQALLHFLQDPIGGRAWLDFGGRQTLSSFGVWVPSRSLSKADLYDLSDQLATPMKPYLGFLEGLPLKYRCGDVVFTHAGLDPNLAWDQSNETSLLWGHDGFLRPDPIPGLRVVHGHYDSASPVSHPGRLCVDTGAYYSGRLTAVRLDDKEAFISVDGLSPYDGL